MDGRNFSNTFPGLASVHKPERKSRLAYKEDVLRNKARRALKTDACADSSLHKCRYVHCEKCVAIRSIRHDGASQLIRSVILRLNWIYIDALCKHCFYTRARRHWHWVNETSAVYLNARRDVSFHIPSSTNNELNWRFCRRRRQFKVEISIAGETLHECCRIIV